MRIKRTHTASDPQLPMDRHSPGELELPRRLMLSVSGESFERGTVYGSINEPSSPCCVAGEHFLTSCSEDFVKRSLSLSSAVNVDISDINGEGEARMVPLSLRRCQNLILNPYLFIISLVGWRPWFKESINRRSRIWCFVNMVYPGIVIALTLYHFVFQAVSCQGKYDMNICTKLPLANTGPTSAPMTMVTRSFSIRSFEITLTYPQSGSRKMDITCCQHMIPTYLVPAILHFLAFAYGLYHFRIQECEQMYSLMERVFLQARPTPSIQNSLIRNSRIYMFTATIWLILQVALEVFYNLSIEQDPENECVLEALAFHYRFKLLPLKLVAMILVHCVNIAVLINYCTQCEMLIYYIRHICLRLHERSIEIKAAMHEILGVREFISLLNGNIGKMMAFSILNFSMFTVIGTAVLILNKNYQKDICVYRTLFAFLWFAALILPLVQAARLSRTGCKLRQISFEMRVFGYQNASQLELDSFVLFVNGATLRAKLFGVAIRTASIVLTLGATGFILLILMVIDLLSLSGYKKLF